MYVLIYVDDVIVIGSHTEKIDEFIKLLSDEFIKLLSDEFALKNMGILHYFLGIEFIHLLNGNLLLR